MTTQEKFNYILNNDHDPLRSEIIGCLPDWFHECDDLIQYDKGPFYPERYMYMWYDGMCESIRDSINDGGYKLEDFTKLIDHMYDDIHHYKYGFIYDW